MTFKKILVYTLLLGMVPAAFFLAQGNSRRTHPVAMMDSRPGAGTPPDNLTPPPPPATMSQKETIRLVNNASIPLLRQGLLFLEQKEFTKAIEIFTAMIKETPVNPHPYYLLAILYTRMGNTDAACRVLEQATEMKISYDLIFNEFIHGIPAMEYTPNPIPEQSVWVAPFKNNKVCAVTFAFDDGARTAYTHALPILEQFGFKGNFNINPGTIDNHPHETIGTWEQWIDAAHRGFEIGNHTMNHTILMGLTEKELNCEVNDSYDLIVKHIQKPPPVFVFPRGQGYFDEAALKKVMERHLAIIDPNFIAQETHQSTFMPTFGGKSFSPETAKEVVKFTIANKLWLVAFGHSLEEKKWRSFRPMSGELLAEYASYVKQNEDKIWVDTISSIYRYLYAKDRTQVTLEKETNKGVTFRLESNLDPGRFAVPLTVIINPKAKKFHTAAAQQNDKPIETQIRDGLVYVEVLATETAPVTVRWE